MFKKKPSIKTLSPLRSSDRRKIADSIISNFGLQVADDAKEHDVNNGLGEDAAPSSLTALRNSILPDNSLSAKFSTTSGPNLKPVNGTVYVGSYGSGSQRVLWVKIDEKLFPTVYSLWQNPGIVPLLHTPSIVVEKIYKGADLMTPGLAFGPPFPAKARKSAVVAIASMENPSIPIAVGTCVIDVNNLTTVKGAKGIAVSIFHWSGDDLWDWSTSGQKGLEPPDQLDGWQLDDQADLSKVTEDLGLDDNPAEASLHRDAPTDNADRSNIETDVGDQLNSQAHERSLEDDSDPQLSTKEIDSSFYQAMLFGLSEQKKRNPLLPSYGLSFPLSQSSVISSLVLPFLPITKAHQTEQLALKKTSWKTPKKFLKAFEKEKILFLKEQKNEVSVLDVDFEHSEITGFVPYPLPTKKSSSADPREANQSSSSKKDSNSQIGIQLLHLYRPRDKIKPLFENFNTKKPYYTASDVKEAVKAYVEGNDLVDPDRKRFIRLDPVISNSVLSPDRKSDADFLAKKSMPRDVLGDRVLELCAESHAILKDDDTLDSPNVKVKSGAPPRAGILLETRSGNKTVTIVHGIEPFFISPQPLAEELRKSCAGSTTVEPWKGGKGDSVLVQGPQKDAVLHALATRGVSRAWVDIVDKTKKKK